MDAFWRGRFTRGGGARSPRRPHKPEIIGSNPIPATEEWLRVVDDLGKLGRCIQ